MFKFAVDADIMNKSSATSVNQPFWMYGGEEKSDRLAAKGASHDLST